MPMGLAHRSAYMLSPHTFVGTMSAEPAPSLLLSKPYLPSLHVHPHASIRFRGSAAVVACLLWLVACAPIRCSHMLVRAIYLPPGSPATPYRRAILSQTI